MSRPFFLNVRDLNNLVNQFFCPPLPDLRTGAVNAAIVSSNDDHDLEAESDNNNDRSLMSNLDNQNTTQSQCEVHIMRLMIAEDLDAGADIDIDIGSNDDDSTSDSNITIIINSEAEDNAPNPSDAFKQFKALLQNSVNHVNVLSESAKLMDMLTLGCDKGSITMDHKFKSRTEHWFTSKSLGDSKYKTDVPQPDQPCLLLRRDSIIELHVRKGGQEQVLEYRALAFLQSIITSGLSQFSLSFLG